MATLKKNQTAKVGEKYSYQYVDIAQIHEYLESINARYIQQVQRIDGDDYILTKRCFNDKWEEEWLQGCRVVDATLFGNDNPAQKQGSALTYARRYSLLMAFGLATEDDDANCLNNVKEITLEDAKEYRLGFGKHKGKTFEEIKNEDLDYLEWLVKNTTSPEISKMLELLYNMKKSDYEVSEDMLKLVPEILRLVDETGIDFDTIREQYNIKSLTEVKDIKVLQNIKNRLISTKEKQQNE